MNERIYQHSMAAQGFVIVLILIMLVVICLALGAVLQALWTTMPLASILAVPLALLIGLFFIFVIFTYTAKTIVSEEAITTRSLLGSKTLRWMEVARVSGRGYRIKLHNFDEDVTVSPSPRLPDYEEVIEWIGRKRPDLFGAQEFSEMHRGIWQVLGSIVAALAIFGLMGLFLWSSPPETIASTDSILTLVFLVVIIFAVLSAIFSTPQAVAIEGGDLRLKYPFSEKTLAANEIASIHYTFTRTRNGKQYFIAVNLVNGKPLRISGLNVGLPVAYLVLKNWHARNT